jgi:hypothetical protein
VRISLEPTEISVSSLRNVVLIYATVSQCSEICLDIRRDSLHGPRLEKANSANILGAAEVIRAPVLRSIHQHISFIILKSETNCFSAPRQKPRSFQK